MVHETSLLFWKVNIDNKHLEFQGDHNSYLLVEASEPFPSAICFVFFFQVGDLEFFSFFATFHVLNLFFY